MNRFDQRLAKDGLRLNRARTEILQINVGKICNLTCNHCHVNAGPKRREIMTRETIDRIVDWLAQTDIPTVDITGGAPEMIPDFRYFIERVRALQPWPGATLPTPRGRVKVLSGHVEGERYVPDVVQLPGKKPAPAKQVLGDA